VLDAGPSARESSPAVSGLEAARLPDPSDGHLRLECEYWTIVYSGQVLRLRDTVGVRHLAQLLWHPYREFHALELIGALPPSGHPGRRRSATKSPDVEPDQAQAERARIAVAKALKRVLERLRPGHPALADHLSMSLKRGYVCAYRPDPLHPIRWKR
jgi:hypothetical protein